MNSNNNNPSITIGKRKARSVSPSGEQIARRRFQEIIDNEIEFQPITVSTPFYLAHHFYDVPMQVHKKLRASLRNRRVVYDLHPIDFTQEYDKLDKIIQLMLPTEKAKKQAEVRFTTEEWKKLQVLDMISQGDRQYAEIAQNLNLGRQNVRNWTKKYEDTGKIFPENRGRPPKLTSDQIDYLVNLVDDQQNLGITLAEIKYRFVHHFNLRQDAISVSTISRYLKKKKKTYKKIIWKKSEDNSERTKDLRKKVAIQLLHVHLTNLCPVFIDESSFNLQIRNSYGWGTKGQPLSGLRPAKSNNYSLLAAMDIYGIAGWMVFRGSVKKEDFFAYMINLVKNNDPIRWRDIHPIFFMDNAKIHHSKLFMRPIFSKHYLTLYNAPYSPQLNPIEYCFNQIKTYVGKQNVKRERELMKAISEAIQRITAKDCAGYVLESFKYMKKAYHGEDFI